MSRITIEDEYTLIIVDVPVTEERNNRTYYVPSRLVLSSPRKPLSLRVWNHYQSLMSLSTVVCVISIPSCAHVLSSRFSIAMQNFYLTALRSIDRKSEQIESQLHQSTRNEELIELMELEKNHRLFQGFPQNK